MCTLGSGRLHRSLSIEAPFTGFFLFAANPIGFQGRFTCPWKELVPQGNKPHPQSREPIQHHQLGFDRSEESFQKQQTDGVDCNHHSGAGEPMPFAYDEQRNQFQWFN